MPRNDTAKPIRITEVGPRDGLQNESVPLSTEAKIEFVNALAACGFAEIEVSSFVSPKWTPNLADASEVFGGINRIEGVLFSALVPNERGLERALEARVDKIAVFTAASETFNRKNINASISESLDRLRPVVQSAKASSLPVRGYVSCVIECPYEGAVDAAAVANVVERLLEFGVDEIDLGETIGVATPRDIRHLYRELAAVIQPEQTTLHLHDTRGAALSCVFEALKAGVRSFDASAGGLGGCPYAPGAAGNLATEDLVYALEREGWRTGIDLERLAAASQTVQVKLGRTLPGRYLQASCARG
ncbi:MAG: hydroxymethylglutaryl-CoA lyase [Phycisphaerales bacterium]